jgi:hypothetical protein
VQALRQAMPAVIIEPLKWDEKKEEWLIDQ